MKMFSLFILITFSSGILLNYTFLTYLERCFSLSAIGAIQIFSLLVSCFSLFVQMGAVQYLHMHDAEESSSQIISLSFLIGAIEIIRALRHNQDDGFNRLP